jgi:uncharacterized membrane protein
MSWRHFVGAYGDKAGLLLSLLLSSALSVALLAARMVYAGKITYLFLVWNLWLAWIPLGCALLVWSLRRTGALGKALLGVAWLTWLIFFPNAPYIITDLMHLRHFPPVPIWYDVILVFSFAWNGLMVGFVSLWIMQHVAQVWLGRWAGWGLVGATLIAGSFGVYIGRFLRWNSWDILLNPGVLGRDLADRLLDPLAHPRTLAVTALFAAFLALAYVTLRLAQAVRWDQPALAHPDRAARTPTELTE